MAKEWSVKFEGLKELEAKFRQMPIRAKAAASKAVETAAKPIAERAGQLAPVGKSGELQHSIIVETPRSARDGSMTRIGPDEEHWYGIFPELGGSHFSAKPYLRPAFDEFKDISVRIVGEILHESLS